MTDGCEWVVDARGCNSALLADLATMRALFARVIEELQLTVVADAAWHVFPPPGGITGIALLAESHLTVHTFPEHGTLCLNLFCCKPRADWPWQPRLRELLGAQYVDARRIERNYATDPNTDYHQSVRGPAKSPPAPVLP